MDRKKIAKRLARIAIMLASGTRLKVADVNTQKKLEEWINLQSKFPMGQPGVEQALVDVQGLYLEDIRKFLNNAEIYNQVQSRINYLFDQIRKAGSPANIHSNNVKKFYDFLLTERPTYVDMFNYVYTEKLQNAATSNAPVDKKFIELYQKRSIIFEQYIQDLLARYSKLIGQGATLDSSGMPSTTKVNFAPSEEGKDAELFNLQKYYLNFKSYKERLANLHIKPGQGSSRNNPFQGNPTPDEKTFNIINQINQSTLELSSAIKTSGVLSPHKFASKNLLFHIMEKTTVSFGVSGQSAASFNVSSNATPMDVFYSFFVARMMPDIQEEKKFVAVTNPACIAMLNKLDMTMAIAIGQANNKVKQTLMGLLEACKTNTRNFMKFIPTGKALDESDFKSLIGVIQTAGGTGIAFDSAIQQSLAQGIQFTQLCLDRSAALIGKMNAASNANQSVEDAGGKVKKSSITAADQTDKDIAGMISDLADSVSDLCNWFVSISKTIVEFKDDMTEKATEIIGKIEEYREAEKEKMIQRDAAMSECLKSFTKLAEECDKVLENVDVESNTGATPFNKVDFGVLDNTLDYDVAASDDNDKDL